MYTLGVLWVLVTCLLALLGLKKKTNILVGVSIFVETKYLDFVVLCLYAMFLELPRVTLFCVVGIL